MPGSGNSGPQSPAYRDAGRPDKGDFPARPYVPVDTSDLDDLSDDELLARVGRQSYIQAVAISRRPGRKQLAAIKMLLEYSKAKPAAKVEQNISGPGGGPMQIIIERVGGKKD